MLSLIFGSILGLFVVFVFVIVPVLLLYNGGAMVKIIVTLLSILIMIGSGVASCEVRRQISRRYIETFTVEKQTIENNLNNEKLSEIERFELLKQVTTANKELAKIQYDSRQWYGFDIDDRVLELSFISLQ